MARWCVNEEREMVFKTIFRMPVHRLAGYTAAGALGVMTTGYFLKSVKGKGLNHNPIYRYDRYHIRLTKAGYFYFVAPSIRDSGHTCRYPGKL